MTKQKIVFQLIILATAALLLTPPSSDAGLEQCGVLDPSYQPDPAAVATLKQVAEPTEIVVFYGNWCKDSHREIPRFLKILGEVNNPNLTVTEYEVNRQKIDATGKVETFGIEFVPTFILIRGGKELGRVVENADKSLAEDLAEIMSLQD